MTVSHARPRTDQDGHRHRCEPGTAAGTRGSAGKRLRLIGALVMAAGLLFTVAGAGTWLMVSNALGDERHHRRRGRRPLRRREGGRAAHAYYQADIIEHHALESSAGKTYAELDREDPVRATVMNGSFLRASLFTSVVSFGVAAMAMGLGIVLVLLGFAVRSLAPTGRPADAAGSVQRDGPDQLRPALRAGQRTDGERPVEVRGPGAEVGQAAAAGGPEMPTPSSRTTSRTSFATSSWTTTRVALAWRAALDRASRSTASTCSPTSAGTPVSTRPDSCRVGEKPSCSRRRPAPRAGASAAWARRPTAARSAARRCSSGSPGWWRPGRPPRAGRASWPPAR
jgi:hypothetical protein